MIFRIAVPSSDGERVSENATASLLYLVYETKGEKMTSCARRAQMHGIMATVGDCDMILAKGCSDPLKDLLWTNGVKVFDQRRGDAERAVHGFLKRRSAKGFKQKPARV